MQRILVVILLCCGLLFAFNRAFAQNLVKNHSFENAWTCPEDYCGYAVKYPFPDWINPNYGTPDLMHSCSPLRAGVPENFAGYMYPYDGGAYAGIILREKFDDSLKVYRGVSREYLQTKLTEPLKKNTLYCVKFYYVNAKKSMYSVDALGITLTVEQIKAKNADRILQRPQITNRPGHIMDNMDEWTEFCGYYRARGGEQYLTIGNFWDNSTTQYVTNHNEYSDSAFFYAYYLIDKVSVFEIESEFECGCLNDLAWSSDWKSDSFDPATGYNTKKINDNDLANNGDGNNGQGNGDSSSTDGTNGNGQGNNGGNNAQSDPNETDATGLKTQITKAAFDVAEIGDRFRLNQIYFEFNSSELLTMSYIQLDSLYNILEQKPTVRIEIRGHTDNIGNEGYNKKLSVERAASVYNYLLEKGIPKTRMKYRGFGPNIPVADNSTEEGRELNRRVEIFIVEI
ncbi:MAG: OmpA family protein [Bacteroidales bacterium]|jgi:outer membrane protein OmpA-like peptidoglycan-associated protein|nr:OmpA family protein [Bacteroidales bacterium]